MLNVWFWYKDCDCCLEFTNVKEDIYVAIKITKIGLIKT